MSLIASQITSLTIVYSTVYSDTDQRKYQSSASLTFVWGIHRGPVNSPHKWPVTRKMFPFDDVIMTYPWYSFISEKHPKFRVVSSPNKGGPGRFLIPGNGLKQRKSNASRCCANELRRGNLVPCSKCLTTTVNLESGHQLEAGTIFVWFRSVNHLDR